MFLELSKRDKLLIKKLHASGTDIKLARAYAEEIIKKNWFRPPWSRGKGYIHQGAYVTALVVSYGRPFAPGRGGFTFPRNVIPYGEDEFSLHDRSEERRVGKECVSTFSSRESP